VSIAEPLASLVVSVLAAGALAAGPPKYATSKSTGLSTS
jgi:hypothetical protein